MMRALANSLIWLVLVPPALLSRLPTESVADEGLSTLLTDSQLAPVAHNTTYEDLRNVSPMLESRTGLETTEYSMVIVSEKLPSQLPSSFDLYKIRAYLTACEM